MALVEVDIYHAMVSTAADDGDPTHQQGADWNHKHKIDAVTLTAGLNAFTTSLQGMVPASGGGTAKVLLADGSWVNPPGRLLAVQVLSAASGTYTPTTGTKFVRGRMVGGGGGGGGAPTASGNQSVSGGGASGSFVEFTSGTPGSASAITGGAFVCGAAGAAGATTPANGGTGGDTTIVVNATTITAKGGLGGALGAAAAVGFAAGGATQAGSSAGVLSLQEVGAPGINISNLIFYGGAGGGSPMGAGGPIGVNGVAGTAGTGAGAGGGGAATSSTARAGAAGTAGLIIVEEYA